MLIWQPAASTLHTIVRAKQSLCRLGAALLVQYRFFSSNLLPPHVTQSIADLTSVRLGKSKVINKAIQDIGMGRYQWELFALCGFGWTADNLWLQVRASRAPAWSLVC